MDKIKLELTIQEIEILTDVLTDMLEYNDKVNVVLSGEYNSNLKSIVKKFENILVGVKPNE